MIIYVCAKCGERVEIDFERMGMRCPKCGGKIFYKERGPVAKDIKAR
ncbi:MAG: DNA-directed RNA polymerase subunit P [Thermoplasmatales archaeon]|nr:DNA-directed RNA polymerase subunit P [Thermoplasmatales archaeon]